MRPQTYSKIDGGTSTARIHHAESSTRAARDERAYWNVLGFAKEQPDAPQWAADIVSALGLDQPSRHAPSKLRDPGDSQAQKIRAKLAAGRAAAAARRATEARKIVAHGTPQGYRLGCGCEDCRRAITAYNSAGRKKRRDKARAARKEAS